MEDDYDLEKQFLYEEISDLKQALAFYADERNWHSNYEIPYPGNQNKFNIVWAKQENGWEVAKLALGDF